MTPLARPWLLGLTALLSACDGFNPQWKGWVYPDASNLSDDISIGRFSSLEECRNSARALIDRLAERRNQGGEAIAGDYECGYQCKPDGELGGLNVCKKTEK